MPSDIERAMAVLRLPGGTPPAEAQLREAYRRRALALHPDKTRDKQRANAVFAELTAAYKLLLEHVKGERSNESFHDLKRAAAEPPPGVARPAAPLGAGKFDVERFNGVFSETRVDDYTDDGHGDWLRSEAPPQPEPEETAVTEYREPKALHGMGTSFRSTYEYGTQRVDDFSGDNFSDRDLCFMDVRKAYAPPREAKDPARRAYRSVEELKEDRADVSYEMTAAERDALERAEQRRERSEAERLEHMRRMDRMHAERYERAAHMLTGVHSRA